MTKTRVLMIAGIILIGGAYLAGYWPEHRRVLEGRARLQQLEAESAADAAQVRLGHVLGHLLAASDAVAAQNYGAAATLASAYFDRVAEEARRAPDPEVQQVLDRIQQTRDRVTAELARAEPSVRETLRQQEIALRRVLGYPLAE
jgi:hypothetical protein